MIDLLHSKLTKLQMYHPEANRILGKTVAKQIEGFEKMKEKEEDGTKSND